MTATTHGGSGSVGGRVLSVNVRSTDERVGSFRVWLQAAAARVYHGGLFVRNVLLPRRPRPIEGRMSRARGRGRRVRVLTGGWI